MELSILINQENCTKCLSCVRVCPSRIFEKDNLQQTILVKHSENCIKCGHCVAVCGADAVLHTEFPARKVHPILRDQLPSPQQVMQLCRSRRSCRVFLKTPIKQELLDDILEAAHRAPTASNLQNVRFTLITDPEKLNRVIDFTIDTFVKSLKKIDRPLLRPIINKFLPAVARYIPVFKRIQKERQKGNDMILRGATALLLIHTPKKSRFGCQDANLAYQNGSLMAEALGVGQFYTGFVCSAIKQGGGVEFLQEMGITGTIHAAMALGMPAIKFKKYIDKEEIEVRQF